MARRYGTEVFVTPTGITRVHHPDISDEEWEKRHKQFERTCARFLINAEEAKRKNEQKAGTVETKN